MLHLQWRQSLEGVCRGVGNGQWFLQQLEVHQQKSKFNKRILIDITGTTGRFLGVTTSISCNLTKNTLTIYFF